MERSFIFCEFNCSGHSHLAVNSSIIASFLLAGDSLLFIGDEQYFSSIKKCISDSGVVPNSRFVNLSFISIQIASSIGCKFKILKQSLKANKSFFNSPIFFLSGDSPDLLAILFSGILFYHKVFFCLHGVVDSFHRLSLPFPKPIAFFFFRIIRYFDAILNGGVSLLEYSSYNLGLADSVFKLFCNISLIANNFFFIHFKPSQHHYLLRHFLFKSFHRKVIDMPLPVLFLAPNIEKKTSTSLSLANSSINIVSLGRHSLLRFVALVQHLRIHLNNTHHLHFSFCGYVTDQEHALLNSLSINHFYDSNNIPVPDSFFEQELSTADLGLLLYSPSYCRFGESLASYQFTRYNIPSITTSRYLSLESSPNFIYLESIQDISFFLCSTEISPFLGSRFFDISEVGAPLFKLFDLTLLPV